MPVPSSIRSVLAAGMAVLLVGCGTPEPSGISKDATIRASVRSTPEIDPDDATRTGATQRRIAIEVHPHCVDGSHTLDCEGIYTFAVQYRVREQTSTGLRCGDVRSSGFQYFAYGELHVVQTGTPAATRPVCGAAGADPDGSSAAGGIVAEAELPMADVAKTSSSDGAARPAAFQATMRVVIAADGTSHYEWRGRDGARCTGTLGAEQAGEQPACTWR